MLPTFISMKIIKLKNGNLLSPYAQTSNQNSHFFNQNNLFNSSGKMPSTFFIYEKVK